MLSVKFGVEHEKSIYIFFYTIALMLLTHARGVEDPDVDSWHRQEFLIELDLIWWEASGHG